MWFKKKPVIVEAHEWRGDNLEEMVAFTGVNYFRRLRDNTVDGATAEVFDEIHNTWVRVWTGQWIIRGVKGEFYPIAANVLEETYDKVEQNDSPAPNSPDASETAGSGLPTS